MTKLRPFKIKSTGITIYVPPISLASLTMQLRREMPEPKPPLVKVTIAGREAHERNIADPDYINALKAWEQALQLEATDRFLKRVALKQRLTPEQKREVDELREALENEDLPKNDKLLWFYELAIGTDEDITDIILFSQKMKDPQEDAIMANANGFQGKLQATEHMESNPA